MGTDILITSRNSTAKLVDSFNSDAKLHGVT
jgi:hypothetical protein